MLKEARKHKNGRYKIIQDRWNNDDKHRKALSDIVCVTDDHLFVISATCLFVLM